ncbi:MAG: hypothetical protein U9N84_08285 [Actinomycetota bacterium]|nr:hypothetical protein [Actinomycetota bacterium]
MLRRVALLGLASLAAGVLVGGVGGRVVMSVSAQAAGAEMVGRLTENGNRIGEFTVAGTIGLIVFVGVLGGAIGSVPVVASDPWLRWLGPLRGLGFGVTTLAVAGYSVFDSVDFLILEPAALNVGMFVGLVVAFGLAVVGFNWLLDKTLPAAIEGEQPGYLVVVSLGVFPLVLATLNFTSSSFCGCHPAYEIGAALLVMAISTGIHHAAKATKRIPEWLTRTTAVTGYLSLAAAVALGLNRTITSIQQLL